MTRQEKKMFGDDYVDPHAKRYANWQDLPAGAGGNYVRGFRTRQNPKPLSSGGRPAAGAAPDSTSPPASLRCIPLTSWGPDQCPGR